MADVKSCCETLRYCACALGCVAPIGINHNKIWPWCRYGFQVAGTLLVFIIFLILLLKVNRSVNTADLEPADKPVFWVKVTLSSKAFMVYKVLLSLHR